jgi:signal peptidase I
MRGWIRRGAGALWTIVLPGALAGLVTATLIPPLGSGLPRFVSVAGRQYTLLFAVALFLVFSAIAAYWRRVFLPIPAPSPARRRDVLRIAAVVAAVAAVALALRTWVVQPYRVLSSSMLPTLQADDQVVGIKTGAPQRGDLVVFRSMAGGPYKGLVKRVVGLPGDRIAMRDNTPVINGWPVPTCDAGEYADLLPDGEGRIVHGRLHVEFLDDRAYLTVHSLGPPFAGEYVVKPGEVFVLGDNRGASADSRSYGGVPVDAVSARVTHFLVGARRTGDADLGRLLQPIDALQTRLRLEAVDTRAVDAGIARCLERRPDRTTPPISLAGF